MRQGSQISSYLYDLCVWQFFFLIRLSSRSPYIYIFRHSINSKCEHTHTHHIPFSVSHIFHCIYRACIYYAHPRRPYQIFVTERRSALFTYTLNMQSETEENNTVQRAEWCFGINCTKAKEKKYRWRRKRKIECGIESNLNEYYGIRTILRAIQKMRKQNKTAMPMIHTHECSEAKAYRRPLLTLNPHRSMERKWARLHSGLNKVKNTNISCVMYYIVYMYVSEINCLSLQSIFFHYLLSTKWYSFFWHKSHLLRDMEH